MVDIHFGDILNAANRPVSIDIEGLQYCCFMVNHQVPWIYMLPTKVVGLLLHQTLAFH